MQFPGKGEQNPSVPPSVNWDDLSVYKADLVQSEEAVLASLGDASVYHLDLTVAPDFQSVSGNEQVRYTNQETVDLPFVYFRLFPNESGGKETVSTATVDLKAETASSSAAIKVMLAQPLKPGASVTIQLDFIVIMPAGTDNNFGLLGYFNNILALDSFFPIIPVYDDKGWHIEITDPKGDKTYNDAAFFLAKINAPSSMSLVASGVEVRREVQGSNQAVTFAPAAPLASSAYIQVFFDSTATDASGQMIKFAKEKFPYSKVRNLEFHLMDARQRRGSRCDHGLQQSFWNLSLH